MGSESEIKAKFNHFFTNLKKEGIVSAKLAYQDLEINYTAEGGSEIAQGQNKTENIAYLVKPAPVKKKETKPVKTDWEKAVQENSVASFDNFLKSHPDSSLTDTAVKKRNMVKKLDEDAWQSIQKIDNVDSYLWYLREFPAGIYQKQAKNSLKRLKRSVTVEKINSFSNLSQKKGNGAKVFAVLFTVIIVIAVVGYFVIIKKDHGTDPVTKKIAGDKTGQTEVKKEENPELIENKEAGLADPEQKNEITDPVQDPDNTAEELKEGSADLKSIVSGQEPDQSGTGEDKESSGTGEVKSVTPVKNGQQTTPLEKSKETPIKKIEVKKEDQSDPKKEVPVIKKPNLIKEVKTIPLYSVSKNIVKGYRAKMKRLVIMGLRRGVKVSGQIRLQLNIDQTGKISIMRFDHRAFSVVPRAEKTALVRLIMRRITNTVVKKPRDKRGRSVKVNRWILSYSVGFFQNKLILNLQN